MRRTLVSDENVKLAVTLSDRLDVFAQPFSPW